MRQLIVLIILTILSYLTFSQTTISGRVVDSNGQPLPGANIMLKGTYDGAGADETGKFSFITNLTGKQVLLASFIGYATLEKEIVISGKELKVNFELKEQSNQLGSVVIAAGVFEAGDQKKSVTLQPLDLVTTPSSAGDIYGALTSLPGATVVGEDGRLFVRGGDGYESKTFIDGLLVKKPYSSTTPDLPSRGRFSPFLFSGTMFSTGGYSAEYGQALSSALILNTNAFPQRTQTDIGLMTVGMSATQTFKSKDAAASVGVEYYNLQPYFSLVKQRIDWEEYPHSAAGTFTGRYRMGKDGILKVFSNFIMGGSALSYPDMSQIGAMQNISLNNQNTYTNINYSGSMGGGWILKSGVSFTYDENKLKLQAFDVNDYNTNLQGKITLKKKFTNRISFLCGGEEVLNVFNEKYAANQAGFIFKDNFKDYNSSAFAEAEINPLPRLALRTGIRGEYSSVIDQPALSIRTSAAYSINKNVQLSFAYGSFYQTPEESLLKFKKDLNYEKAQHFIANVQYEANDRILRVEGYYKKYSGLVTHDPVQYFDPDFYKNNGNGYSKGIDIFFRDRKSIRFFDYWISYSFLDAKRYYRDYPTSATPPFAAKHSFNVVGKKWVEKLNTMFGVIFTWASGRPYNNPNSSTFMGERTADYMDISLNLSYLTRIFDKSTIVYSSLSNVLGRDNVYSYRYYSTPNQLGKFESIPVRPEAKRFFMIGVFITL